MSQRPSTTPPRATAETMAGKQREISVSEFFAKNRHLLGFDNPRKALLTTVKEAVDNALDACEEAGILPDILVKIEELEAPPSASKPGRYRVTIGDNGPGIVRRQVENIFGKLLYGSKFHRLKMSRGQQGIGISAAGMYGLMTTGKPMVITTRPNKRKPAHHIELAMDTTRNKPEVSVDIETEDFEPTSSGTGTTVSIELEARYQRGKVSVLTYLEQTAIANPHAEIVFIPPGKGAGEDDGPTLETSRDREGAEPESKDPTASGSDSKQPIPDGRGSPDEIVRTIEADGKIIFPRTVEELPAETSEIKPHPYGVELGTFLRMLKQSDEKQLGGFFKNEFCRIAPKVASEVYKDASSKSHSVSGQTWLKSIDHATAERLYKALQASKLRAPPTDCLSPIGVRQMLAGLLKGVRAEFYAAATRPPSVYRGMPFQIEAAIAFGGDLPSSENGQTEPARVIRFANRVPLLYQQSACSAFKSVTETAWRNYGITQPRGGAPVGPLVIMIHMASVWVPFTSESKEAIADYDEIRKEMKLALQECGRKLGTYMRRRQRMKREGQRRDIFERYIGEISRACAALTEVDAAELYEALKRQAQRRTEIADAELDDEGNFIKSAKNSSRNGGNGRLDDDDGVLIVDSPSGPTPGGGALEDEGSREVKPAKRGAKGSSKKTKKKSVRKKKPRPEGAASSGLFGSES